jgi:hypothetical protein
LYMEEIRKRMTSIFAECSKCLSNETFVWKKKSVSHSPRSSFMVISSLQRQFNLSQEDRCHKNFEISSLCKWSEGTVIGMASSWWRHYVRGTSVSNFYLR